MKLNKGFEFKIDTTRHSNLLKKMGNEIGSTETRKACYFSNLTIKKNAKITLIFLSKETNGYIAYICNYFYGVGEFVFYTHSEVKKITETFNLIESKEPVLFCQWRLLSYKDSVITEFIDPLVKLKSEYNDSLIELESKKVWFETLTEELNDMIKRYDK